MLVHGNYGQWATILIYNVTKALQAQVMYYKVESDSDMTLWFL